VVTLQLVDTVKEGVTVTAYDQTDSVTLTQTPSVTFTGPVPGKPATPTAKLTAAQTISVSWLTPAAPGDDPVAGYVVTPYIGTVAQASKAVGAVTSAVFTGLAKGTAYAFTVAARNSAGSGPVSAKSTALTVPATVPGAPTAVTGTRGNAKVTLTWKAPTSTGGSPITGYTITAYAGSTAKKTLTVDNVHTATVTGLTNGTAYTFRISARNAVGAGPTSTASAALTPATIPGAPTAVTGTRGNAKVTLTWKAPTSTGGSPITGYTITAYAGSTAKKTLTVGNVHTATVTGLTNGTAYTFTVTARNAVGNGAASSHSPAVTPTA
jgi:titin